MSRKSNANPSVKESDPRFPSGEWTGHYVQLDRQYEMTVVLTFCDGRFDGLGLDIVGMFDVAGTYDLDTGAVSFLKKYHCQHEVDYNGWAEVVGGGMWGRWRIGSVTDRGGWHLWPRRFGEGEADSEQETKPLIELDEAVATLPTEQP